MNLQVPSLPFLPIVVVNHCCVAKKKEHKRHMHKGVLWWVYPFKLPVLLQVVFNWLECFLLFYLAFNFSLMKCMNYWIPPRHCFFNHNLVFFFLSFLFLYANSAFLMLLVIKNAPFSHANTNWRWGWLVFFYTQENHHVIKERLKKCCATGKKKSLSFFY